MSADTITDAEMKFQKRRLLLPESLRSKKRQHGFELTRDQHFVNGQQDIFDILANNTKE